MVENIITLFMLYAIYLKLLGIDYIFGTLPTCFQIIYTEI